MHKRRAGSPGLSGACPGSPGCDPGHLRSETSFSSIGSMQIAVATDCCSRPQRPNPGLGPRNPCKDQFPGPADRSQTAICTDPCVSNRPADAPRSNLASQGYGVATAKLLQKEVHSTDSDSDWDEATLETAGEEYRGDAMWMDAGLGDVWELLNTRLFAKSRESAVPFSPIVV